MEIRIIQLNDNPTIKLAAEEAAKYLPMTNAAVETAILLEEDKNLSGIRIGYAKEGDRRMIEPSELDDEILIRVKNGEGVITGSNDRSVLIAVYRFLREAGCRWVRPGKAGEKFIPTDFMSLDLDIHEKASYRHRGVCVEGQCSFQHVKNMIEWMPKVGLNAYFNQFMIPYSFYNSWYEHQSNPFMTKEKASVDEVAAMVRVTERKAKERGMMLHKCGHGWTSEPFGIHGYGWDAVNYQLTEEESKPFALINGKRGIWEGIALNTNLCYSNPKIRAKVVDTVVNYSKMNPQVDYLHFWLADVANNHCECEECRKMQPSDYYMILLNEIDAKLTEENLKTRIVFLVYLDLLWAPKKERLIHKDRFVLMFAPISRTYSHTFFEALGNEVGTTVPYQRNNNVIPKRISDNVAYLKEWQKLFDGDSFDFDYHMLWDWEFDLAGYRTSEVLFKDMEDLHRLGLNGMNSCQSQRVAFPTALGMVGMAQALWKADSKFDDVVDRYYMDLFDSKAAEMKEYFKTISRLCHAPYLRMEENNNRFADDFKELGRLVRSKKPDFEKSKETATNECDKKTWYIVCCHADFCLMMSEVLEFKISGEQEKALKKWEEVKNFADHLEPELNDVWDSQFFMHYLGEAVRNVKRPGIEY